MCYLSPQFYFCLNWNLFSKMRVMSSLFSVFDPVSSLPGRLNWTALLLVFILFPQKFFFSTTVSLEFHKKVISTLHNEFSISIQKINSPGLSFVLISFFFFIAYSNFFGLYPYVFTGTRHLTISVRLILSLWVGYTLFYIIKSLNCFLSHLVPSGAPFALMPFMVIIEVVRLFIRPLTLSVRLTANMIAGHMLITLVSSPLVNIPILTFIPVFIALLTLVVLELAVSVIQSYVFRTLLSLYVIEINSPNF